MWYSLFQPRSLVKYENSFPISWEKTVVFDCFFYCKTVNIWVGDFLWFPTVFQILKCHLSIDSLQFGIDVCFFTKPQKFKALHQKGTNTFTWITWIIWNFGQTHCFISEISTKNNQIKTIILKHQPWMIWPNFGRRICQFWREMWQFSQPSFKPICFPPVPAPWPPSGVGALASAALGRLGQMASRWWLRPNRQPANCTLGPRELEMKKGAPGGWWYLGDGMENYNQLFLGMISTRK